MKRKCVWFLVALIPVCAMAETTGSEPANKAICIGCHGVDGNSTSGDFPRLAGQGKNYLAKQLRDFKSGKRKEEHMSSMVEAITLDEIPALAAWFSQQKIIAGNKASNPLGQRIFQSGITVKEISACSSCHGEDGKGNDAAGFPLLAGQHADYLIKQLKSFRAAVRTNDNQIMQAITQQLSDKEIEALAQYLSSLK